jgi:glycosyltransferase involved in cell wall biosynthesis
MPDLPELPPVAHQSLSVVLLARNDAAHAESVIGSWLRWLDRCCSKRDHELILVDDGSTDGTGERLARLAEGEARRVQVRANSTAQGEGAALRTGLATARCPLIAYTLCQPRYQPADLERLLTPAAERAPAGKEPRAEIDLVHLVPGYRTGQPVPVGWRWLGRACRLLLRLLYATAPQELPGWLGWRRHLFGIVAHFLFGVRNRDPLCPFRLLRREVLARIPLQSQGPFVHLELLAKATFLRLLLGEDAPLTPPRKPRPVETRPGEELTAMWADLRRVLLHPEFAPPPSAP